jgi:hypothetical protein
VTRDAAGTTGGSKPLLISFDGTATLPEAPPDDPLTIAVHPLPDGRCGLASGVVASRGEATIRLEVGRAIRGRIEGGGRMYVSTSAGFQATSADDGRFVFPSLPAGRHILTAVVYGPRARIGRAEANAGDDDVRITADRDLRQEFGWGD